VQEKEKKNQKVVIKFEFCASLRDKFLKGIFKSSLAQ
jgi:hypothetical protein